MTREQLRNRVAPLLQSALEHAESEALAEVGGFARPAVRAAYRALTSRSSLLARIVIEIGTQALAPQAAVLIEEARELFATDGDLHPAVLQALREHHG